MRKYGAMRSLLQHLDQAPPLITGVALLLQDASNVSLINFKKLDDGCGEGFRDKAMRPLLEAWDIGWTCSTEARSR